MRPDPAPPINFPDDPISLAELVATAVAASEAAQSDVDAHEARVDNPHVVTAAQTGAATTGALAAETTNRTNADTALSGLISTETTDRGTADTALQLDIDTHEARTDNPHAVTAAQTGAATTGALAAHEARVDNPHAVTKAQVGLGNADDTSDANKPVSIAQAAADALALHLAGAETATGVKTFSVGLDVYGRDGALQVLLANAANRGEVITGAASQSANLWELRNSANMLLSSFSAAGVATLAGQTNVGDGSGRGLLFGADAVIRSAGAATLLFRNAADSAYTTLTALDIKATARLYGGAGSTLSNIYHYLQNNTAASVALVIRGAASQSTDLLEVQNSAAGVLVSISASGVLVGADIIASQRAGAAFRWAHSSGKQTTVGAAGAAAALPATPTTYLRVRDDANNELVIPAYAQA